MVKNLPTNVGDAEDTGLFPRGGHGNPLQYSCLETPMDRRGWRATVHGVTKNWNDWAHSPTSPLLRGLVLKINKLMLAKY